MRPTRILVVDDSLVVRTALSSLVQEDPQLEMAGTAATGLMALELLPRVRPDVVILDIEMPGLHGLQVLEKIRLQDPDLPVIMFSTATERSASATLEALAAGATDFVLKPSSDGTLKSALGKVREQLFGRIKTLFRHPPIPHQHECHRRPASPTSLAEDPEIVAIGCSTGGPNALAVLLPALPGNLAAPVVVVQHMPPIFTKTMADRLNECCALEVREARDGVRPKPGEVWVAPGGQHLVARRDNSRLRLHLDDAEPVKSCKPSVDVLFESLARDFGRQTLGLILTGMGSDGLNGCEQLESSGGRILAQDEASSVVWGMPGAVVAAGLADKTLPLDGLAAELMLRVGRTRSVAGASPSSTPPGEGA